MRRFLTTAFAVFYTVALLIGATDRTATWAAQKADAAEEKALGPGVRAARDYAPYHPNRRIVPSLFVVEPPLADSGIALISQPHSDYRPSPTIRRQAGPPVPSRAPPRLS